MKLPSLIASLVGALLLVALLCSQIIVHARVSSYCSRVKPGESIEGVMSRAESKTGFRTTSNLERDNGRAFLVFSSFSMRPTACIVENDGVTVTAATFSDWD